MKPHTVQHGQAAVTRLLAPLRCAGELAQSLVATRHLAACALRTRLAILADVSGSPTAAAATSAAGRLDPLVLPDRSVRERRFDTEPKTPLTHGENEPPTRSTDEAAPSPEAAGDRSQLAAVDVHSDSASLPHAGHQREEWSPEQRAALEATARRAVEDALRPVRIDQRALAEDVRACRAEPPAFQ